MECQECQWSWKHFDKHTYVIMYHSKSSILQHFHGLVEKNLCYVLCLCKRFQRPEYTARAENFRKLHVYVTFHCK